MILTVAGLVVMGVGVVLVIAGLLFARAEYQKQKEMAVEGFIEALAELVKALAGQPKSLLCFTFGTLLIFVGGIVSGASALAG